MGFSALSQRVKRTVITGILVALPEELRSLTTAKLKQGESLRLANDCLVILSGVGADNAQKATQKLIAQGAEQLISWGCAGALAPELIAGELIIPTSIQTHTGQNLPINSQWHKKITASLGQQKYSSGILLESLHIVASAVEKSALYSSTQALATDMESAVVARIAQQANLPFMAIRSIVDDASFDLPHAIQYAMRDNGQVAIPKIITYLIYHPTEIPRLIQLGRHFKAASKTLANISPLFTKLSAS